MAVRRLIDAVGNCLDTSLKENRGEPLLQALELIVDEFRMYERRGLTLIRYMRDFDIPRESNSLIAWETTDSGAEYVQLVPVNHYEDKEKADSAIALLRNLIGGTDAAGKAVYKGKEYWINVQSTCFGVRV